MEMIAANCPADVKHVAEINVNAHTGIPFETPEIPKAKETATYASPMGIPESVPA
jgi:hypothetical protein